MAYNYDIIVIGGGPAGYAAAIRAGQLKKRTLCIEKENLGGTCLNWGCIPTKALLENGALIRRMRHAKEWGVSFDNLKIDFPAIIGRSRTIADKLSKGIAHLFRKHDVKHEMGTAVVLAPHKVRMTTNSGSSEVTAEHIVIATGARARTLPGVDFDTDKIITSREAMNLPSQPKSLAIIGAGAIGCEFADFYNAIGTQVTLVEMLDHLLPNEDEDCSIVLERSFAKRGINVMVKTRTDKVEKTASGVKLTISNAKGASTIEADRVLIAIGVTGNIEEVIGPDLKLETFKNHIKVDRSYRTNIDGIWAVGDVIGPPWLAHVAHHEAVACIETLSKLHSHEVDYVNIPGCTYTHPQVASMGLTERKARETGKELRIGKFPFSVSGRALAAGETEGFVKLIFDAKYGELLGVHMIGENVTELLSELVLAKQLEGTEEEILSAMHPHPTLSEAVMEAAGAGVSRAIHI
jgi:dihydrolipoyl dehydrogenase